MPPSAPRRPGRPADPARRDALRGEVLAHLEREGLAGATLRSVAAALGVSTYALTYHFGSWAGVVSAALALAEERQMGMVASMLDRGASLAEAVRAYLAWATDPRNRGPVRLAVEAYAADAARGGDDGVFAAAVRPWLDALAGAARAEGADACRARALSTLVVAASVGLSMDLLASGERTRVDDAVDLLVACTRTA